MRCVVWFAALVLLNVGCSARENAQSDGNADAVALQENAGAQPAQTLQEGLFVGEPVSHGNLTVFPVLSKVIKQQDRFITLDEALSAGLVEIMEVGAGDANSEAVTPQGSFNDDAEEADTLQVSQTQEGLEDDLSQVVQTAPVELQRAADTQEDPFMEDSVAGNADETVNEQVQNAPDNRSPTDELSVAENSDGEQVAQEASSDGLMNPFSGPEVNTLLVLNRSDRPLYLMPGEVLLGGQQDRTIGEEIVIQPGEKPVEVAVFCVEHGRWHEREEAETNAYLAGAQRTSATAEADGSPSAGDGEFVPLLSLASSDASETSLAAEANQGKFIASVGSLSNKARMAVQAAANQQAVWDEVASENDKSKVDSASGTFTKNYVDVEAVMRLEPYMQELQQPILDNANVVGVVVAVNGKPQSMDVFESTPLFKKLWPKLLKSYALDAANSVEEKAHVACSQDVAEAFLAEAAQAQVEKADANETIALTRRSSENVVSFSASDAADAQGAAGMGGMGGFGGAVHSSAFAK